MKIDPSIVPLAQLMAYMVFTGASIFVAAVAAFIASKNANGSKPIILVKWMTFSEGKTEGVFVQTAFEIWNRRKYPVVVRKMQVRFVGVRLEEISDANKKDVSGWHAYRSSIATKLAEVVVEPNSHREFSFRARLAEEGDFDSLMKAWAKVRVLLFDPKKNVTQILERRSRKMGDRPNVELD